MLALAQMARGYQQALRMALLFAFTLAFAVFTLSFNASQVQRLTDGVGFQVGSDFSGILSGPGSLADWQTTEQGYAQIPGVQAAMIGHAGIMQGDATQPIDVLAVDAGTCAQTMDWSAPDSPQSVAPLLRQLVVQRQASIQANLIPVLVDASAAQSLGLATGSRFSLKNQYGAVTFVTLGIVQHIPSILDDSVSAGTSDTTVTGGILADYATFAGVQSNVNGLNDVAESIWLKSSSDPTMLARVRNELNNGQLQVSSLSDRRALTASLFYDPLEDALQGWLLTGATVALVLGLFGTLLGSWSSARKRVLNFALMRALGNTPGQIVRIVLWEQGIIYAVALCIGLGGGAVCAWLLLPGLLYTPVIDVGTAQALTQGAGLNLTGTGELYLAQGVPAVRVVIPMLPTLALCGVVLLICLLALTIIVCLVTRPALSESLRMSED